jgi:hypothetical protein
MSNLWTVVSDGHRGENSSKPQPQLEAVETRNPSAGISKRGIKTKYSTFEHRPAGRCTPTSPIRARHRQSALNTNASLDCRWFQRCIRHSTSKPFGRTDHQHYCLVDHTKFLVCPRKARSTLDHDVHLQRRWTEQCDSKDSATDIAEQVIKGSGLCSSSGRPVQCCQRFVPGRQSGFHGVDWITRKHD